MPLNNIDKGHVTQTIRFDIAHLLESIAGYKGIPFPAALLGRVNSKTGVASGADYQVSGPESTQAYADNGAVLRRFDLMGNYYFMPVSFVDSNGKEYEIDCALVSIQLKKNIVETPLVGRRGTIKELISCQDFKISVTGCLISDEKGFWPEDRVNDIKKLFDIDDSVSLKCALTDCFFSEDDKVVITDLTFPSPGQVEDVVPLTIECVSDQEFELNL